MGSEMCIRDRTWTVKALDEYVVLDNGQEVLSYEQGDRMDKPSGGKE